MLDSARRRFATDADRIVGGARRLDLGRPWRGIRRARLRVLATLAPADRSVRGAQPGNAARRHHRPDHGPVDSHRLWLYRLPQGSRSAHLQGGAVGGASGAIHLRPGLALEIRHRPAGGHERDPHHHCGSDRAAHPQRAGRLDDAEGGSASLADICPAGADIRRRHPGRLRRGIRQPAPAAGGGRRRRVPCSGPGGRRLFRVRPSAARRARPDAGRARDRQRQVPAPKQAAETARGGARGPEHALRCGHPQHVAGPVPVRRRAARGFRQSALCRDLHARSRSR